MAKIWTTYYKIQQFRIFFSKIQVRSSKSLSSNQEDRHPKPSIICCSPNRLRIMLKVEAQTHNKRYLWAVWLWPNSTVSFQHMDWKMLSTAKLVQMQEKRICWQMRQVSANRQIWIRRCNNHLLLTKAKTWHWTQWIHLRRWAKEQVSKQHPPAILISDYVCSSKSSSCRRKTKSCSNKFWTMSGWEWILKIRRKIKCYNCSTCSKTNSKT